MTVFERTDFGNAQRLAARYGDRLRYCPEWRKWLVWTGTHWDSSEDSQGQVDRWAWETIRHIRLTEVKEAENADVAEGLVNWSRSSETLTKLRAMVELTRTGPGRMVSPDQLDADPWILPCINGTLDLRTGRLRETSPEDYTTKSLDIEYRPDATAPTWNAFLDRVQPNPDVRNYLQRAAGYTLTGLTREQKLFMLYGTGANGKSVFLDALQHVLGEYAATASSGTILNRRDGQHTEDLARLAGARLVTSIEVEAEKRMTEAIVKSVTGGDPVAARFMRGNTFEYVPQFKLWLAVNHPPVVGSGDHGIWRRLVTIPWEVRIPEEERDKELVDKLAAEREGILAWMVRGAMAWRKDGLDEPVAVMEAAMSYRESMDDMGRFLDDMCATDPSGTVPVDDLYIAAAWWWEREGLKLPPKPVFGRQLTERGIGQARIRVDKAQVRVRTGIRLTDPNMVWTLSR